MLSLSLKYTELLSIRPLLEEIGIALEKLLGLTYKPVILAEEYIESRFVPLQADKMHLGSNAVRFKILNEPEAVSVFTYDFEETSLSKDEQGVFVSISPRTCRTPLEVALAAAVAIAFGRKLGTAIRDFAAFYTPILIQPAERFFQTIKVKGSSPDYRVAAQSFYETLPKALKKDHT